MQADLATLKNSLRLDISDDDDLLQGYLDAAKYNLCNAIGAPDGDAFYQNVTVKDELQMAILAQASAYYQNRSSITTTPVVTVDLVVNSIVGQLRGRYATLKGGEADGTQSEPKSNEATGEVRDSEVTTEQTGNNSTNV